MKIQFLIFVGIIYSMISCEQKTNDPLQKVIQGNDFLEKITHKKDHEVQIIWTQINRDSSNHPSFKSFEHQVDSKKYFYPASTVKLPVALLALEKINRLDKKGLNKNAIFHTDSAFSGQSSVYSDSTSENNQPSIGHYIKKILVASDNDAYNRLYEFIGQENINEKLKSKNYQSTRISHRLSIALTPEQNAYTNPVKFYKNDTLIYHQELTKSSKEFKSPEPILRGVGYTVGEDPAVVNSPFDFTHKNFIPLGELHSMLKAVIFPEAVSPASRFDLTNDDYQFLYQYMSQLPRETAYPSYSPDEYYDAYVKFLLYGNDKNQLPKHIRIFNKIGQAYGYMIENAYVVDLENNIEFMVSAVIHVNANQIYNDGIYEYDKIGFPFMKELGQAIYKYELERGRKFTPDLTKFDLTYDLD